MTPKRALLLITDQGFHWDSLADSFHLFADAGWQVHLASPRGHPKVDPASLKVGWLRHWLRGGTTKARLPKTPWWGRPVVEALMRAGRFENLKRFENDVIFVVDSFRMPLDLVQNAEILRILDEALEADCWMAAPADLLKSYKISGRTERVFGYRSVVPGASKRAARRIVAGVKKAEQASLFLERPEYLDRKSGRLS